MSERMRESLSALMDGESNELELQRILSEVDKDAGLRQTWQRYHAVRSAVSGEQVSNLNMDISERVREALVDESSHSSGAVARMLKPFASFAVAASVAAVVLVGGQQLSQVSEGSSVPLAEARAGSPSPVYINMGGAAPVTASYGWQKGPELQPAARTAYRKLARQRMQKYMQEHAEHAALNSPQGLLPFVRVQQITE